MTAQIRSALSVFITALISFLSGHCAGPPVPAERWPDGRRLSQEISAEETPPRPALNPDVGQAGGGERWRQSVAARIAQEEYFATTTCEGLQAPNRSHDLRTYFRQAGIEVVPRKSGEAPDWRFVWKTSGFGRPGALRAVEAAGPEPDGSRITYCRPAFDEWYENSPGGLEQGFTVHAPPPGEGPLCIAGRLAGSLQAELRAEAGAVELVDDHGARVLRYGGLYVLDAGGGEVPSRLSLDGADLAILVDDSGAAYPLTVDPIVTSPAWTAEGDQIGAGFGISVATAGDVNGDGFSDVIVGAYQYDNGEANEGRVYVYHGSAAGLASTPTWTAESNQFDARLGISVATAGASPGMDRRPVS
jgi:hypothetical protein